MKTPCFLSRHDIKIHGYLDQGISMVANNPSDGYNGVVAFNDRDGEYQMNQLWLTMERKTHNEGCGIDIGGRIDFIYGTDARFMQATDGFEDNWKQTSRFYPAAVPQAYIDVAVNDWTFRMGKWFTFLEYEEDEATHNFFYSHSYTKEYGEPYLHTGILAIHELHDRLELKVGLHRGWNQFDDTDGLDDLSFIGGFKWLNCAEDTEIRWGITAGEQGPNNTTVMYDLVVIKQLSECVKYVFQHDWASSRGGSNSNFEPGEWYGIVNYLEYEINPCWSAGARFEWFRDDDGERVSGHGDGNDSHGHFEGNFYEVTLGLNWTPSDNIRVRPEVRWDWFDGILRDGSSTTHGPYDGKGDQDKQFMFAIDVILLL